MGECSFLRTSDFTMINRAQQKFRGSENSHVTKACSYLNVEDEGTKLLSLCLKLLHCDIKKCKNFKKLELKMTKRTNERA